MTSGRILIHLPGGVRQPVEPDEIYFVEADGGDCLLRFRGSRRVRDVRTFGEVVELLAPHGFVRIHRRYAVNPRRVRAIRPAGDGGWEIRLDPPVNRVLPVSRRQVPELFAAYGERD